MLKNSHPWVGFLIILSNLISVLDLLIKSESFLIPYRIHWGSASMFESKCSYKYQELKDSVGMCNKVLMHVRTWTPDLTGNLLSFHNLDLQPEIKMSNMRHEILYNITHWQPSHAADLIFHSEWFLINNWVDQLKISIWYDWEFNLSSINWYFGLLGNSWTSSIHSNRVLLHLNWSFEYFSKLLTIHTSSTQRKICIYLEPCIWYLTIKSNSHSPISSVLVTTSCYSSINYHFYSIRIVLTVDSVWWPDLMVRPIDDDIVFNQCHPNIVIQKGIPPARQ